MKNKLHLLLWVILILSMISAQIFYTHKTHTYNPDSITERFQEHFSERESSAWNLLRQTTKDFKEKGDKVFEEIQWVKWANERFYNDGEVIFVSRGDSILFLSHNALPVHHYELPSYHYGIHKLHNGWYYILSEKYHDYQIWVTTLIKNEFRYKNRFLQNKFSDHYNTTPEFVDIADDSAKGEMIFNRKGDYAFSLVFPTEDHLYYVSGFYWFSAVIFYAIAIVLLLFLLIYNLNHAKGKMHVGIYIFLLLILFFGIRYLMFAFQIPNVFYEGDLFSASYYATSYILPSLGDLFLNVIFANLFIYLCFFHSEKLISTITQKRYLTRVWLGVFMGLTAFAAYYVIALLESLVINSNLQLDVNFIFSPDIYNLIGFLIIAGLFFAYYFLSKLFHEFLEKIAIQDNNWKYIVLGFYFLFVVLFYHIMEKNFLIWIILFSATMGDLFYPKVRSSKLSLSNMLLSFFLFAIVSTYALSIFNKEKEHARRESVALRIASEQDPIAEFLFYEIEDLLRNDYVLFEKVLEDPYDDARILQYLKREYFYDYWARYDIQLTSCAPGEVLYFKPYDEDFVCDLYFKYYIQNFGRPTLSDKFIYLDNNTGRNSYITAIPVRIEDKVLYTLYIEFESKFIPRDLGFPELLVDEQIDITRRLGDYSYAIYKNNMMTHKYGTFFYSIHSHVYESGDEIFHFFESDGYSHLMFQRDDETQIMVSRPGETLLGHIAPFSYLFIMFLVMVLMIWFTTSYLRNELTMLLNFKKRLQIAVIGIVLISVLAIGGASAWFIFNIYENKNESIINEKAHSILIEMENHLIEERYLDETYQAYLNQLLLSLSQVFFTDINLFHPQGNLLASSRPRVFDEGLISAFMHPLAFNELKVSAKSFLVHYEKIGNLQYNSAYVPLRNIEGMLIAYINLPYFAQESELRNEITFFLVAFINIYLLLLLLSVIIAFFISNHVTRPLQIIRDSISKLSIGKSNKKISWNRRDEIGQLIKEYNRMIDELAVSAELLAKSERESAWREMARQVAHEIKNPLTPMRLHVQYLQRAWKDNADNWDQRLDSFTKSMVEQIDNLTVIASEFSDFAKMPQANNEKIDLREFIPSVLDLYKGFENVNIHISMPNDQQPVFILVDRNQLLRVFNNLIKNAIQAYQKRETANIYILCQRDEGFVRLQIKDHGVGIPDELKKNIFQPYFTTKSSGMGLGLAMVKSIITSFDGHISFESNHGKGTSFIIRLPDKGWE